MPEQLEKSVYSSFYDLDKLRVDMSKNVNIDPEQMQDDVLIGFIQMLQKNPNGKDVIDSKYKRSPEDILKHRYDVLGEMLLEEADLLTGVEESVLPKKVEIARTEKLIESYGKPFQVAKDVTSYFMAGQKAPDYLYMYNALRMNRPSKSTKEILEERSLIRKVLTSSKEKEGLISRDFSRLAFDLWGVSKSVEKDDQGQYELATTGIAPSVVKGLSNTMMGGSFAGARPMEDPENIKTINYLRKVHPFYKEAFPEEVKLGDRKWWDHALEVSAFILGSIPEFKASGAAVKGIAKGGTAIAAAANVSRNRTAAKVVRGVSKYALKSGKGPATLRTMYSLAAHSAENGAIFGLHSLFTGRPKDMLHSAVMGAWMGAGNKLMYGNSIGITPWRVIRGAVGGGLVFAVPQSVVEYAQTGKVNWNRFAGDMAQDASFFLVRLPGISNRSKKGLIEYNKRIRDVTGYDVLKGSSSPGEGYKKLRKKIEIDEKVIELDAWNKRLNVSNEVISTHTEEPKPSPKTVFEASPKAREYRDKAIDAIRPSEGEFESAFSFASSANPNVKLSQVGRINNVLDDLQFKYGYDVEQRNQIFKAFKEIGDNAKDVYQYEAEIVNYLSEYFPGYQETSLSRETIRNIYQQAKNRAWYGDKEQFNLVSLSINDDSASLRDEMESKRSHKYKQPEYKGPLSDGWGDRISIFEDIYITEGGKSTRKSFSELTQKEFDVLAAQLSKQGLFLLPMRSDSGKGFVAKAHEKTKDKRLVQEAYDFLESQNAFKDIESSLKDYEGNLTLKDAQRHAVNLHFYLQDFLGENYVEGIKASGQLGSILDVTKRMQIIGTSGIKANSRSFKNIHDVTVEGDQVYFTARVVKDAQDIQKTDGESVLRNDVADMHLYEIGANNTDKTSNIKSFVYQTPEYDPNNGAFLGKLKFRRATALEEQWMQENGVHVLFRDSAAKYRGKRKLNEDFRLVPESIRTKSTEHYDFKNEDGSLVKTYANFMRQILYAPYSNDSIIHKYRIRAKEQLSKELEEAQKSPEAFSKWFRERVMKKARDTDEEGLIPEEQIRNARNVAETMMEAMDYSKVSILGSQNKAYAEEAIFNYLVNSMIKPQVRGHIAILDGLPQWAESGNTRLDDMLGKQIKNDNEIIVGSNFKDFLIADLKGSIHITDSNGKSISTNAKTLGDLFKERPDARVSVMDARAPIEDIGGVRAHYIVGIGPDGTGNSVYMRPRELNFLGGADNDYDKVSIYFEDGKAWHDELKKFNNDEYLKDEKYAFEADRLNPDGTIKPDVQQQRTSKQYKSKVVHNVGDKVEASSKPKESVNPNIWNPMALASVGQNILNAKNSIGRVMSLDRVLKTILQRHGKAAGEEYDRKMLYWKRTAVDAKHGGFSGEWKDNQLKILTNILGSEKSAKKLLNSKEFQETSELFNKVFGRNSKEDRSWTYQERLNAVHDYYSKNTPKTALEQYIADMPKFEASLIPDINIDALEGKLKSLNIPVGGQRYTRFLKKYGLNSYDDINNKDIPKEEILKLFVGDIDNRRESRLWKVSRELKNIFNKAKAQQQKSMSKDMDFREKIELFNRLQFPVKTNDISWKDYFNQVYNALELTGHKWEKDIAENIFNKANDFISKDIVQIATTEYVNALKKHKGITQEQERYIARVMNRIGDITDRMYNAKDYESRKRIEVELEKTYQAFDKFMQKNDTWSVRDYIGLVSLGKYFDPDIGATSGRMQKINWSRWVDYDVMYRIGQGFNSTWDQVKEVSKKPKIIEQKSPSNKLVNEPEQQTSNQVIESKAVNRSKEPEKTLRDPSTEHIPLSEEEIRFQKTKRFHERENDLIREYLAKMASKDKATQKAVDYASKQLERLVSHKNSPWTKEDFFKIVLNRKEADMWDFANYPLSKEEVKLIAQRSKQMYRVINDADKRGFAKLMWEWSTPETVLSSAPEAFDLYYNRVRTVSKMEAKQNERRNVIRSISSKLYDGYKNLEMSGTTIKDIIELGQLEKKFTNRDVAEYNKRNNTSLSLDDLNYHQILAHETHSLFNEMWTDLNIGYNYYLMNLDIKFQRLGLKREHINRILKKARESFKKRDKYFPHIISDMDAVNAQQAQEMIAQYEAGQVDGRQLADMFVAMHAKKRKAGGGDKPVETDINRVVNTYIENVYPWAMRQQLEYQSRKSMKALVDRARKMLKEGKNLDFIQDLIPYVDNINDAVLGKYRKERDLQLIAGEGKYDLKNNILVGVNENNPDTKGSTFFIKYKDPEGNIRYKDLGTSDFKQANERFLKHTLASTERTIENMSNSLLSLGFMRNIPFSVSSTMRNHTQRMYPIFMTSFKVSNNLHKAKKSGKTYDIGKKANGELIQIDINAILRKAHEEAGLHYGQTEAEIGRTLGYETAYEKTYNELNQAINGFLKSGTQKASKKLANALRNLASISSTQEWQSKSGKTWGFPGREKLAFGKIESSVLRPFAFDLGFYTIFNDRYDKYQRVFGQHRLEDAYNLAFKEAVAAGRNMINLTQFDYHMHNTPQVMRKAGVKGASLRQALQFKKYTINYYKMIRKMFDDSITSYHMESGARKVFNREAGRLASLLTVHGITALASKWTGANLYNYIQDDFSALLVDWYRYISGDEKNMSHYSQKETPIPFTIGPNPGWMLSSALTVLGMTGWDSNEFVDQKLLPRGAKKHKDLVKGIIEGAKAKSSVQSFNIFLKTLSRFFGLYPVQEDRPR